MSTEYTPDGASVTFTVPDYEDTADGPQLARDLADDVAAQMVSRDGVETLTNKTLSSPTINSGVLTGTSLSAPTVGDFSNAQHDHSTAAKGGAIPQSSVTSLVSDLASKETVSTVTAHTSATAAHGATGSVVGTTNTQTLTNKTLASPTVNSATVTGSVTATGSTVTGGTLSGQTITGASLGGDLAAGNNKITGLGTPTTSTDAATKAYVDSTTVASTGDTMSGELAMGGNKITGMGSPTTSTDAVTKGYVDTAVSNVVDSAPGALDTLNELAAALGDDANFSTTVTNSIAAKVAKAGDTVTGDLTMSGGATVTGVPNPSAGSDAANKTYADLKVGKSGDTMTGNLTMSGGAKVTGLPTPSDASDATPKSYIDQLYGSTASAAASDASAAQSAIDSAASAGEASDSAVAALASEQAAALSETSSTGSEAASASSAAQASTSAGEAATSASQAAASQAASSASEIASAASEVAASASEAAAATSEVNAAASESLSQDWATKMVGTVDGSEYSAKYYASIANPAGQVTETGAATLSNKTMSGSSNTFSDIPQSSVVNLAADLAAKETPAGAQSKADAAATTAQAYADGLAVNYDAAGAAATAQGAAQSYADGLASNYDPAGSSASAVSAHSVSTTSVHGIADTASLETVTGAQTKANAAQAAAESTAGTALSSHSSSTTGVHGIADTANLATQTYVNDAIGSLDALPSQTGEAGKFLTTDGTAASWGAAVAGDLGTELATLGSVTNIAVSSNTYLAWNNIYNYSYESTYLAIEAGDYSPFGWQSPEAVAYIAALQAGDSITFIDAYGSKTETFTFTSVVSNSDYYLEGFGYWTGDGDSSWLGVQSIYIVDASTTITTDSAATATTATGLTDGYFAGSTPLTGGTASGSDISFTYAIAGVSNGDPITYWDVPNSLDVKKSSGVQDVLEFDSQHGMWRTTAGPMAGTWVSPPQDPSTMVSANGNYVTSTSAVSTFERPFPSPRGEVGIHFVGDAAANTVSPYCSILTLSYGLQISTDGGSSWRYPRNYMNDHLLWSSTQTIASNRFHIDIVERWSDVPITDNIMVRLVIRPTGTPTTSVGNCYIYLRQLSLQEL